MAEFAVRLTGPRLICDASLATVPPIFTVLGAVAVMPPVNVLVAPVAARVTVPVLAKVLAPVMVLAAPVIEIL